MNATAPSTLEPPLLPPATSSGGAGGSFANAQELLAVGAASRAADALVRRLWLVRGRWRWITSAEAILLGLVAALVVAGLGLAVAALVHRSDGAGLVLSWTALVPAVGTIATMLVHRWRSQRDLATWAQVRAERHAAVDGELLRSGVELAHRLVGPALRPQPTVPLAAHELGSPWLLVTTLADAEKQATGLDIDVAAIAARCRRYAVWLSVAVLLMGATALRAPDVWRAWWTPPGEPAIPPRDVGTMIGDSHLQIDAPTYAAAVVPTRQEDRAEATVLRGSHVKLQASPLPGLQVEAVETRTHTGGRPRVERQPVALVPGQGLVWQITLLDATHYRYVGRDDAAKPVREASWRELKLQPDEPPRAVLAQPTGEVDVRAGQTLQLVGQIDDDLGLQQVELVIQRPATGIERRPVSIRAGATHHSLTEGLAVDGLQLRPGEVAEVLVEATDTNPFDGARKGASEKLRVRMFSADRHHGKSLDLLAQLADEWTLRLGDRLERDPAATKVELPEALKTRSELASAEQKALDQLRVLRQQIAEDTQARPSTLADLEAIEKSLADPLADEARSVTRSDPTLAGYAAVRELYALQRHHALMIGAEEQAVAALTELAGDEQEAALARDSQTLADTERNLLSTLEKMADSDAKPLQAEAERLLDLVEQQMDRMAASAQKRARLVPYEHVNAQAVDASGLPREMADQRSALAEVRALLKEGKTRQALEKMRALSEALGQATSGLKQGLEQQLSEEDQAIARLVQDLRRGVDRTLNGQGRVRDDLRSPTEEAQRAQEDLLRQVRETSGPQIQEMLGDARDVLKSQRFKSPAARGHNGLGQARQALDAAEEALQRGQLDGALQDVNEAADAVSGAQRAVAQGDPNPDKAADAKRLQTAQERLQRAADKLRQALPEPGELLRPGTRGRVEGLAGQQQQLRSGLERLRKKLAEDGDAHPALQRQVGERLDHALQTQREVQDSLQRGDARRAFAQTGEVLDALERASEMLQQGGKARSQGQSQPAEGVGMDSGGPVEVRSGNQGDGTEQYRQQVLKAMQQREPGGWHDRLQRYYKAISR